MKTWKTQMHNTNLITQTVEAFTLDPTTTDETKLERERQRAMKKEESKRAQKLALEIASHIDDLGLEKPKVQNG